MTVTTELDVALEGADFVFSAIRVGGLAARVQDERVALDLGVLGQETTGAGGIAYGLRTVPVATVDRRAGPRRRAGRVGHQLHQPGRHDHRGDAERPRRPRRRHLRHPDHHGEAGRPAARRRPAYPVGLDYVGLNHLGWLRGMRVDGVDLLPRLLADDALLGRHRGGPAVRAGLDPGDRRAAQRVPLLLRLHPRRGGRHPVRRPDPRRVPREPAARVLRRRRREPGSGAGDLDGRPRRAGGDLHGRRARGPGPRRRAGRRRRRRLRGRRARTDARHRPRRAGDDDPRRREPWHCSRAFPRTPSSRSR